MLFVIVVRMLWFACRGNVYLRYNEIEEMFEDPISVSILSPSLV